MQETKIHTHSVPSDASACDRGDCPSEAYWRQMLRKERRRQRAEWALILKRLYND